MFRLPRALTDILSHSGTAAALVARVRSQSALLERVKRELGAPLNLHIVAALMHNKRLILYTDSSAWASRLRFSSRTLLGLLVGKGLEIEKITVRIALPSASTNSRSRTERHLSRDNSLLLEKTAETIDDPGLRQALKRLSRHGR